MHMPILMARRSGGQAGLSERPIVSASDRSRFRAAGRVGAAQLRLRAQAPSLRRRSARKMRESLILRLRFTVVPGRHGGEVRCAWLGLQHVDGEPVADTAMRAARDLDARHAIHEGGCVLSRLRIDRRHRQGLAPWPGARSCQRRGAVGNGGCA